MLYTSLTQLYCFAGIIAKTTCGFHFRGSEVVQFALSFEKLLFDAKYFELSCALNLTDQTIEQEASNMQALLLPSLQY